MKRNIIWEYIINFALFYSFLIGISLGVYALYKGIIPPAYYGIAALLFVWYLISWIMDKKRTLDEGTIY